MDVLLIAAAVAQAFNLVCVGSQETLDTTKAGVLSEPFKASYRIDLDKQQYCEGDCREIIPIAAIQPAFIQLYKRESDAPSGKTTASNIIDRTTGEQSITYRWEAPGRAIRFRAEFTKASCQRQPFTGFPTFETKF